VLPVATVARRLARRGGPAIERRLDGLLRTSRLRAMFPPPRLRREPPPLLVARHIEPGARVAVLAARPPAAISALGASPALRCLRFERRRPQPAAGEPHHHHVRVPGLQLLERRKQIVTLLRAKGGRLAFEDDRPIRESRRHLRS
jgi:hypothetical protein